VEPNSTDPTTAFATTGGTKPPSASRPWWKRKWGIAAIVVAVLIIVGGISTATQTEPIASVATPSPSLAAGVSSPQVPTAEPAPTSEPTTVEATPEPTVEPTPEPTVEPTPEPTEEPTPEPTEEPTPEPTEEPTPEPTEEPTPEPTAVSAILKTSGQGDKIVRFVAQDAPTYARITGKGGGNFAVITYTGSEYGDLLVNEIGSYSGSTYVAAGVNRLKVTSSGSWTIEIRPITAARLWDGLDRLDGKGDSVVLLTDAAGGITTVKNKSRSNFAVIAYSPEGEYLDLLVNEIGSYSGEVLLPDADPIVLSIHAVGGTWSMSAVEQ